MTTETRLAMRRACDLLLLAKNRPEDETRADRPARVIAAVHDIPEGRERDMALAALAMFGADTIVGITEMLNKITGADLDNDHMLWELTKRSLDDD